jgi:phosphotransferase system HPr (HPr) family protein
VTEQTVTVHNASGLHARPAAAFVGAAKKFADTKVWVVKGEVARDAKSILQVLQMGVTKGTVVTIRAEGPAEADAVATLVGLIEGGLGED